MANTSPEQLTQVLVEVRKAYRLLYHYQRRIMDTVKYISDLLSLYPEGGYPIYSDNTPKAGMRPDFDRWGWDWLNLYMYEYYFGEKEVGKDTYYFAIQVQSDTGSFDSDAQELDLVNYSPAEKSATRLLFLYGKNRWKGEGHSGQEKFLLFEKIPALSALNHPEFVEIHPSEQQFFGLLSVPLENFIDETTITAEIARFLKFLGQHNIPWVFKV